MAKVEYNVNPISDNDLEMYAEWLVSGNLPEGGEKQITRIAKRVANLGDISSLIRFAGEINKQEVTNYLGMIVQRMSVMEYILTDKLGITIDDMRAYNERYLKELEEAKEMMTEDVEEEEEPKEEEK